MDPQQPMPPELQQPQDTSAMERLIALRLLRENMFYAEPTKYSLSDIAEDLPGPARAMGGFLKNVLPSKTIISEDPAQRSAQIDTAIERIKSSKKSKEELGKEIVRNVKDMGLGAILPGLGLGAAFHLLGPRWIRGNKLVNGVTQKVWQSPITPLKNIGRLFTRKNYAKLVAKKSVNDALMGAGLAAATGAAYPILAHNTQVSDQSLNEARKIMEEQPYITSLPTSEILSVLRENKENNTDERTNKLKNIALGTGIGAVTGVAGTAVPLAFESALSLLPGRRALVGKKLVHKFLRDAKGNALFGGLLGGVSGAFTKNLIADEMNHIREHAGGNTTGTAPQTTNAPQSSNPYPA